MRGFLWKMQSPIVYHAAKPHTHLTNILTLFPKTLECEYLLEVQYFIISGPGQDEVPSVQLLNGRIVTEREKLSVPLSPTTIFPPRPSQIY